MKTPILDQIFFKDRRRELLKRLPSNSLAFVISADELPRNGDQRYPFRQNSDLFYLTGISQEQTILALCPAHPQEKFHEVLFIRQSNPQIETWLGHKYTKEEAQQITGIKTIFWYHEFEAYLSEFMYYTNNVFISVNENMQYRRFYNDAEYRFIEKLKFLYPLHNYNRLGPLLTQLRLKKQKQELEVIKYAIFITHKAFKRILNFVKPGVYEYEIEAEIMHEFIRHGIRNVAYLPIIASGSNANVLHYIKNNSLCKSRELLLMDFGAEYLNYAADLTRTIPVNGRFTQRQKEVYQVVYNVQRQMIERVIKPGITINQINKYAEKLIADGLVALGLIKETEKENLKKIKEFYPHGLSHFLGLDVHDVGSKDIPLEPGMVITVEPGIYIKKEGLGIRLENDVLITEKGTDDLMKDIPLTIEQIEEVMNS